MAEQKIMRSLGGVVVEEEGNEAVYLRLFDEDICCWYMRTSDGWLSVLDAIAQRLETGFNEVASVKLSIRSMPSENE